MKTTLVTTKKMGAAALTIGVIGLGAGLSLGTPAGAAVTCSEEIYEWTGEVRLKSDTQTFDTGLVIPGPATGETLRVIESRYSAFDRYPSDGSAGNRIDAGQMHESFGIAIGGIPFGGLTTDAPNGPDEGAPDEFFSGMVSGSFGTGAIEGGGVVARHASLYGFGESPNSINAAGISLLVERCVDIPETTPPTTVVVVDPRTPEPETTPPTTAPATTVEDTTTTVESNPPQPSVSADVVPPNQPLSQQPQQPQTAARQVLPATGSGSSALLLVASLFAMAGMGLLIVRRRPAGN